MPDPLTRRDSTLCVERFPLPDNLLNVRQRLLAQLSRDVPHSDSAGRDPILGADPPAEPSHSIHRRSTETRSELSATLNNLGAVEACLGNDHSARSWLACAQRQASPAAAKNLSCLSGGNAPERESGPAGARTRIALLSLLFNWPSTGGGTVHTKELADFLTREGYAVRHLYAMQADWSLGQITGTLPYDHQGLEFSADEWQAEVIRDRFRQALEDFQPHVVIVTDSWNSKPLLVEAAQGYTTYIRIAAQECLCPLNNVRLLIDDQGQPRQCAFHQLRDPGRCRRCVEERGTRLSGGLHQAERELVGFRQADYPGRLAAAFRQTSGILAVNPQIAALCRPYSQSVHVIPSGFDPERFPPPEPAGTDLADRPTRFLFAGLTQEYMKGFSVLAQAARLLWRERQDFEVWVTGDSHGMTDPCFRFLGWQSQAELPHLMRQCDVLIFPTLAQEALGRTAVEAMGCGLPVIASRIGGLAWVVEHQRTGLLCRPGDAQDLLRQCQILLEDPELRRQLGQQGRRKFERDFTWESILQQQYRPLLGPPVLSLLAPD